MDVEDLLAGAPPEARVTAAEVAEALRAAGTTLVVLDDDPTGTQSVADLPVLTRWEADDLAWALSAGASAPDAPAGAGPGGVSALYVLTNSRSLSPDATAARTREVVRAALAAADARGERVTFLSRSDSTLRGHFPLETDVVTEELVAAGRPRPDLVLLVPAFPDAGRVTVDGTHWTREGGALVPVGESEFAADATFGYRASALPEWVQEKTSGRVRAEDVVVLDLGTVRRGADAVTDVLRAAPAGAVVAVDAAAQSDLLVVALACARLEGPYDNRDDNRDGSRDGDGGSGDGSRGGSRTLLYRTGPAFVRARVGQDAPAVVEDVAVPSTVTGSAAGGLVVVGSHTALTTRQRDALVAARPSTRVVELAVPLLVDDEQRAAALGAAVDAVVDGLAEGDVLLQTSRERVDTGDAEGSLAIARSVSAAVVEVVARVLAERAPRFVVAKGGITSHDVAVRGLGIARAVVRGPMLPGLVSLWQPAGGPAQGVPYAVFPGNVGDEDGLVQVVGRLATAATAHR